MKKLSKLALALGSTLLCLSTAYSTTVPNTDNPTTFLGPTARLGYTSTITNTAAYSLLGEVGARNYRVGGTVGWKITDNQLFKVSAEYLWQKITYGFFSGDSSQWVNQGALGAAYAYDFNGYAFNPQLGLSAYVSHAPSKNLSTETGSYVTSNGTTVFFVDNRRIAGSTGAGISPGITINPWQGGQVGAELNYDNVRYDTSHNAINEDATGLGGTLKIGQAITDNIAIGASAAVRQPFNNYAANVNWNNMQYYGDWSLGLFGDYTSGKNTLPNTWNVGVNVDYFIDRRCPAMPANLKGESNLKGEMVAQPISDNLLAWTADPAVYMPQVLAIVDNTCQGLGDVTLLSPIPNFTVTDNLPHTFNSPSHFAGNNLTYSMTGTVLSSSGSVPPASSIFSINKTTGVVTLNPNPSITAVYSIAVTASNGCRSVTTTFEVIFNNND